MRICDGGEGVLRWAVVVSVCCCNKWGIVMPPCSPNVRFMRPLVRFRPLIRAYFSGFALARWIRPRLGFDGEKGIGFGLLCDGSILRAFEEIFCKSKCPGHRQEGLFQHSGHVCLVEPGGTGKALSSNHFLSCLSGSWLAGFFTMHGAAISVSRPNGAGRHDERNRSS